jgi:hypothetical protein
MSRGQKQTMRNFKLCGSILEYQEEGCRSGLWRDVCAEERAAFDAESNPPMPPLITWKIYIV